MKRLSLFLLMFVFGVTLLAAQDDAPGPDLFDGDLALQHVANHVGVGPRPMGTAGSLAAGNIILSYLDELGWETSEDWHLINFGPYDELSEAAQQTLEDWQPLDLRDVIHGHLSGSGEGVTPGWDIQFDSVVVPVRNLVASYGDGPTTIIIGAHYDSRIYSDKDPDESRRNLPMPGANDGGSGVGVLLELARVISEHYTPNDVEIRLVFFDAEDNGRIEPFPQLFDGFANGYLVGSNLYASNLDMTTENIQYMLLVDLVGEFDQRFPIEGYSNQYAPELVNAIWSVAADLGYEEQFVNEVRGPIIDDHVPFLQQGIPSVDIIDLEYEYWDTSNDTIDKISPDSLERVGRVLQAFLERSGAITPINAE